MDSLLNMNQITLCREIMDDFSRRTGVGENNVKENRYLWTDAFAVFNYLELYRQLKEDRYLKQAIALTKHVHYILGRHRSDDVRNGWISGLEEAAGEHHPTIGGLRIGKRMTERKVNQVINAEQEWDRDGQYFHYLTKWMLALDCVSHFANDANYHRWAIELAKTAFEKFTYVASENGRKQMYWKMSIDLTYPLVESMGQHDPLDGFITYLQLQAPIYEGSETSNMLSLEQEIEGLAKMLEGLSMATSDTLGIGGLLVNACALTQVNVENKNRAYEDRLIQILEDIELGLSYFIRAGAMQQPAIYRLAFRELGLSIGLHALTIIKNLLENNIESFYRENKIRKIVDRLLNFEVLASQIEGYWLHPQNQRTKSWVDHYDINSVMLATSLAPRTFLLGH